MLLYPDNIEMKNMNFDDLLLQLQFRELALRFLDSFNPKLEKAIVIADAILSFDNTIKKSIGVKNQEFHDWITVWNRDFGVKWYPKGKQMNFGK